MKFRHWHHLGRRAAAAAFAVALGIGTATTASAVSTDYHPTQVARDFSTSAGGWTAATTNTNLLCIEGVTCPAVDNVFVATGGAGGVGDGFIRTHVNSLVSLLSTTSATWRSPTFVYNGAGGQAPDTVKFTLDRRVNAGALLAVLSGASYSVVLDDQAGGGVTVINRRTIVDLPVWTSIPAISVPTGSLTIGHTYRIRVVTELGAVAALIPAGDFDYDNVLLRAAKADPTPIDTDGDGIPDSTDNCVTTPNANQTDTDGDGIGDACDTTPGNPPTDTDGDGVPDLNDNCVTTPNPGQVDTDGDGIGDACDSTPNGPDTDGDGVPNTTDNCITTPNAGQVDSDGDGIGDACDSSPNGLPSGTCLGAPALVQTGSNAGDVLRGTSGRDLLRGGKGNDTLLGRTGADCLKGGPGKDTLRGQDDRDILSGNAGRDLITGNTGNDVVRGQKGNDRLTGGQGNDKLNGGAGKDVLLGGGATDRLYGGAAADRINPGSGKDMVNAGAGDDRIMSADGKRDLIRCGGGADRLVADATDKVSSSCEIVVIRKPSK